MCARYPGCLWWRGADRRLSEPPQTDFAIICRDPKKTGAAFSNNYVASIGMTTLQREVYVEFAGTSRWRVQYV